MTTVFNGNDPAQVEARYNKWWERKGREYRDLKKALTSRPLTIAELQRVAEIGVDLVIEPFEAYEEGPKQRDFAALLLIQQCIQLAAARGETPA